ncbi:ABC-three component system protein [Streptomyces sp. NPDC051578]|uniref:ABC-three component system protein n=1 Tax=Streptomyces sp. NPDC051578 TaxID=3365662 RepID=UPI0037BA01F5
MAKARSHSAAGQMMGYLYQCELALLELARRSWDDITVEVRMELLDDIEFLHHETQDPLELLQSKYREAAGPLSETGKDFWRSVTSWIDSLAVSGTPSAMPLPILRLVSTQVAKEGTFLHWLRSGPDRNVGLALARMEEVAGDADGPGTTGEDRALFMALTSAQRQQLVNAMVVADGAPVMSDVDRSLAKELGITPSEHSSAVLDEIKGWWYRVAVRLLERKDPTYKLTSVSAETLLCRRDEAVERYTGRSLPITETHRNLTEAEMAPYRNRLVVSQMQWIGLPDREITTHLRDYHYARAQRSEWLRNFKVTADGLDAYERDLHYEWESVFLRRTRRVDNETDEAARREIGQAILDDTMEKVADKAARPGTSTAPWIGRGSIHDLCDRVENVGGDRAVGWHPDHPRLCKDHIEAAEQ